jgi:hypothetical protein
VSTTGGVAPVSFHLQEPENVVAKIRACEGLSEAESVFMLPRVV